MKFSESLRLSGGWSMIGRLGNCYCAFVKFSDFITRTHQTICFKFICSKFQKNTSLPSCLNITFQCLTSATSRLFVLSNASRCYQSRTQTSSKSRHHDKTQAILTRWGTSHPNSSVQDRYTYFFSLCTLRTIPIHDLFLFLFTYIYLSMCVCVCVHTQFITVSKSSEESVVSSNAITSPREEIQSPLTEDSTENHTRPVSSVSTPSSVSVSSSSSPREEEISTTPPTVCIFTLRLSRLLRVSSLTRSCWMCVCVCWCVVVYCTSKGFVGGSSTSSSA